MPLPQDDGAAGGAAWFPELHTPEGISQPVHTPPPPASYAPWSRRRLSRRAVLGLAAGGLAAGALGRLLFLPLSQHQHYIYRGHHDPYDEIAALAWSPNSQRIASGASNLQVWDALSGDHAQAVPARLGVQAVAWSPQGHYLAAGNGDGTATVWEAATGKQVLIYRGHVPNQPVVDAAGKNPALAHLPLTRLTSQTLIAGVQDLTWSPDGTRLLSTGPDETTQVWEALTGRTLLTLGSRSYAIGSPIWSPDGRLIAATTEQGVSFWDATSGVTRSDLPSPPLETNEYLYSLAWSPNGQYLAAASERDYGSSQEVRVWEAATGRTVQLYRGHTNSVLVAAWSPDSRRLASAGLDLTVRVWEATSGQTDFIYRGHLSLWKQFFSAQVPKDLAQASGSSLAFSCLSTNGLAGSARSMRPQDTWPPPPVIRALAWSPDGQYVASGGFDEDQTATVQVWQPG